MSTKLKVLIALLAIVVAFATAYAPPLAQVEEEDDEDLEGLERERAEEAKVEAEREEEEAKVEADRLRIEAKAEAERLEEQAKAEADRLQAEAKAEAERLEAEATARAENARREAEMRRAQDLARRKKVTCKIQDNTVVAVCHDGRVHRHWGYGPEGIHIALGNCRHAASIGRFGECPV